MPRNLSGIQPSGGSGLHIGNYFGAVKQHIEISRTANPDTLDALFFVADLHALTTVNNPEQLKKSVREVAAVYCALGFDFDKAVFFRQSDVPEVAELSLLLAMATGMGVLQRAVSYKEKVEKGLPASVGLFYYPLLMAADICLYGAEQVPVGQDQVQHIQIAQDAGASFNARFGCNVLKRPEPVISPTPKIPGVDGEKMSKSYGNIIPLFAEPKEIKAAVARIKTDSRPPEEPKNPDEILLYQILDLFLEAGEREEVRAQLTEGRVGYGHLKELLCGKLEARFGGETRERYKVALADRDGALEDALLYGAKRARKLAQATLRECYEAVGMPNVRNRLLR